MSRSRPRPAASRPAAPLAADTRGLDLQLMAGVVVAAGLVFRGTLRYFFAQDDFTGLARALGLLPRLVFPWRWLSGQLYFDVMHVVAGLNPLGYRLVSVAAHATCAVLVYRLCRRFVPPVAAVVGAVFFATHPAMFTALYSVSGIGEILATLFGLAALLAATQVGSRAWWALPLFAASLLSKESTIFLPLVALSLSPAPLPTGGTGGTGGTGRVAPVVWAMGALALAYLAAFAARDVFGMRASIDAGAPYAMSFDRSIAGNALSYLGWTLQIPLPFVKSFADAVDPGVFAAGVAFVVLWLAGLASRGLRARGWLAGAAWFAATLLPVLPLAHHTYHYYLYAPLAGAAVLVAAIADFTVARWARGGRAGPHHRAAAAWAAVVCAALAVNGGLLVHKIETYPFGDPELRSDATVDRARIAGNAIADLRAAELPRGTRVWFWSPVAIDRERTAGADTTVESYWESNVRSALYDGLAVRVCLPQVASTRFVRQFVSAGDSVRYAVYLPTGHLHVGSPAELDAVLRRSAPREGAPR